MIFFRWVFCGSRFRLYLRSKNIFSSHYNRNFFYKKIHLKLAYFLQNWKTFWLKTQSLNQGNQPAYQKSRFRRSNTLISFIETNFNDKNDCILKAAKILNRWWYCKNFWKITNISLFFLSSGQNYVDFYSNIFVLSVITCVTVLLCSFSQFGISLGCIFIP